MENIAVSNSKSSQSVIIKLKQETEQELFCILNYWMNYAIDVAGGDLDGHLDIRELA